MNMHAQVARRFALGLIVWALGLGGWAGAGSPLDDARAVWHMGSSDRAALSVEGQVALGVPLSGTEREASLGRGGDGQVARFDGGYLVARGTGGRQPSVEGQAMTLLMRLQDPGGQWAAPLLARQAAEDPYGKLLFGRDGALHYVWRTTPLAQRARRSGSSRDMTDGVLRLGVPAAIVEPARWHDVLVRFHGPNLELFVDGVLVDEEWPHGALHQFAGPFLVGAGYDNGQLKTGFHGLVDHVALWDRALADAEIARLSGGAAEVARREREINGPAQTSPQYWKPRGYNAWAGDCMPFFHDGMFHLFYLFDRHHHGSKWHQGAHQYAHLSSKDLVHWQEHPLAVPIIRQWECSMGTCDCIWHEGLYHMFYTDCGARCEYNDKPQAGSWIFVATSTDGIHFHKDLKPVVRGGDCTVFRDPATGLFHLIRGGGNRLVSKDLRNWEEIPGDFVERKPGTTGECPRLFAWNGWFYFILGTNAIWKSRSALGPWEEMKPTIYDGLFVPKVAEFTGNRRILAGFNFERGWAGHLALRELVQSADGSLGTKFPPELVPASGAPQRLTFAALGPGAAGDGQKVTIQAGPQFRAAALDGAARNVRIRLRVVPGPGVEAFGVCVRGSGAYQGGCELRFEPRRQRTQYGAPRAGGLAGESTGLISRGRDFAIENVEGLDRPFALDIIVRDDLVDTCIDGRRTMITRRDPAPAGDRLFFFARGGRATFESIDVRPLTAPGS